MDNIVLSGFVGLLVQAGFLVIFSVPVWLAARVVGADHPTMPRSALSLVVAVAGSALSVAVAGGWAAVIAPLWCLFTFKWILGTSFGGAVMLAVLALAGYAVVGHVLGGGTPPAPV